MDLPEFSTTLSYALSFISITPSEEEITSAFRDIDRNQDGLISYQEYFEFLRYYFGSESYVAQTGGE
jgi:Ca2+-binding EF-hand superfamily protein